MINNKKTIPYPLNPVYFIQVYLQPIVKTQLQCSNLTKKTLSIATDFAFGIICILLR